MELYINSPMYYTDVYGVHDEIYWMCRSLCKAVEGKQYSPVIKIIGIAPIIAPESVVEQWGRKECKKCEVKAGFADMSLQMDYDEYVNADIDEKKSLIIQNVLQSVKAIPGRGKIDYQSFENDVKKFCEENNIKL